MSTSYLLPCSCGRKINIEVSQAGGAVSCTCGAQLDVPAMRPMRDLEEAPCDESPPPARADSWSRRKGTILLGLLIAVFSTGGGVYLWATQPQPVTTNLEADLAAIAEQTEALTPAATWQLWRFYILGQGLVVAPDPHRIPVEEMVANKHQRNMVVALVTAGLGLGMSLGALVWKPRSAPAAG